MADIAVIGAGSYGTCLAILTASAGHRVSLWSRGAEAAAQLAASRENTDYLPGYRLPDEITVTADLAAAVRGKELVLGVTPSHAIRDVLGRIAERACFLSGPTFATEIAAGMPAAIVLAGRDPETCAYAQHTVSCDVFRVYSSDDVTGVLLGGALKNVIAIAAGVSDGLGFGDNARAALITRGLHEITRMGVAMGAHAQTFAGLSGMGDLVLTCAGNASRNRRVGIALGQGKTMAEILDHMRMVAEGVKTTKVAYELAGKLGVPAPITEVMFQIIHRGEPARETMTGLMQRALRGERDP